MWRTGGSQRLGWLPVVGTAIVLAATPAFASAATLGNGIYTEAPNELAGNVIQLTFEPDTNSYRFRTSGDVSDTDGPGGCSVVGYVASCPAATTSRLVVNASDQSEYISVGTNGWLPPMGLSEANQVRIPVEIHGNGGGDHIAGGWGADVIEGGPGSDVIDGNEQSYLGTTPTSQIQAPDLIMCGTGDDVGGNGFTSEDTAMIGPGDAVAEDCDAVEQMASCPSHGGDCFITAPVVAIAGGSGAAAAAGAHSHRGREVVLGVGHAKVPAGTKMPITTRLSPKRIRRALHGSKTVPGLSSVLARRHGETKRLHRTRFRLTSS
jgi:hypothetical protein